MDIQWKDIAFLVMGLIFGLISGVAIYWMPLNQSLNEWRALWNLVRKRYNREDRLTIKAGVDLRSTNPEAPEITTRENAVFGVWHDEGVNWHFTSRGWKRARVLHVFYIDNQNPNPNQLQPIYKVCHLDII